MNDNNIFITDYVNELRKEYLLKEHNIIENSHKQIFTHKENNSFLSLKDILTKKYFIEDSLKQNEINSINEIQKDKFIIFQTTTIDPILNIRKNINNIEEIEEFKNIQYSNLKLFLNNKYYQKDFDKFVKKQSLELYEKKYGELEESIKNQYSEFSKFFKYINDMNYKKDLSYKNIRTYELTKSLNLHSHKLDFLNNKIDFIRYIESLMLSKNKFKVGRIELSLDFEYFEDIKNYFNNKEIKIRVNNKYIILNLIKRTFNNQTIYYIKESKKGSGNFIYFRTIEKQNENDKQHITKYLFKYMLKTFHKNEETEIKELKVKSNVSNEILVFNKLKLKQKVFSENFFTDKLNKQYLEKLNGKFFTLLKQKENHKENVLDLITKIDLEFIENNRNKMFYSLGKLLNENKLIYVKGENVLIQEYIKIKSIVRINIEKYNEKKKKEFLILIHSEYSNSKILTDNEYDKRFLNERLTNFKFNKIFFKEIKKEFFNIVTEENELEILIENISKQIFKYINNRYNFKDTDDEIHYFNKELNELILIHSFSSNYKFEKFNSEIELYNDLITSKIFNNDNDKLITYIKLINSLNEHLEINEFWTLEEVKKQYEEEKINSRTEINKNLENLLNSINDKVELDKSLLNYMKSLTDRELKDFIDRNDSII